MQGNTFKCPSCGTLLEIQSASCGFKEPCPHCGTELELKLVATGLGKTNQPGKEPMAALSLGLGIASLVCCGFFAGLPGIFCGHLGLMRIRSAGGRLSGKGLCIAGILTSYAGSLISIAALIFSELYFRKLFEQFSSAMQL